MLEIFSCATFLPQFESEESDFSQDGKVSQIESESESDFFSPRDGMFWANVVSMATARCMG